MLILPPEPPAELGLLRRQARTFSRQLLGVAELTYPRRYWRDLARDLRHLALELEVQAGEP